MTDNSHPSTAQLRKRNKQGGTEKAQRQSKKATSASKTGSSSRWLLPTALVFWGFFIYFYSNIIIAIFNSWVGISEWESDPSSNSDHIVDFTADIPKRDAVVAAFKHAWLAYERDAMGDDEYHPISRKGSNLTTAGGIGYTVVDSIDTMQLMGLDAEYRRARDWVANKLSFDRDAEFSTFETTIRVLGGLLAAYHLSGNDPIFLERAVELGDRILPTFDTPSGLPLSQVNLFRKVGVPDKELPHLVSTAEASTLQLEFKYLSHLTGNEVYWEKAENVMSVIKSSRTPHGLVSIFMSVETGQFVISAIRLGSRGDSHYEYLLKQYLQTNRTEPVYDEMYAHAMEGVHKHLVQKSAANKMTYTAELIPERDSLGQTSWRLTPKQDHLVCFLGGSLMLGATTSAYGRESDDVSIPPSKTQLSDTGKRDWRTGLELVKTCVNTHDTATGLSPEIVYFRIPSDGMESNELKVPHDWYIKGARPGAFPPYDARYMLRPETVESLFIAFRLTGDPWYREQGWKIFQAIEKHCRVETGGYATVINVDEVPAQLEDKMETFLMSETFKYLFLLFEDASALPLKDYVFNTEAHPLPIFEPNIPTGFS